MRISRVWAMPNRWTFQIPPIADLLVRYVGDGKGWIDPFAGMSKVAEFTNDLNHESPAKSHMDALGWLQSLEGEYQGILFDPPYSTQQVKEVYGNIGRDFTFQDNCNVVRWFAEKREASRHLESGAYAISCGWNSTGFGQGFSLVEVLLVNHAGAHNDTIVTVERKIQGGLL